MTIRLASPVHDHTVEGGLGQRIAGALVAHDQRRSRPLRPGKHPRQQFARERGAYRRTRTRRTADLASWHACGRIGLRESDLERAADLAVQSPYPNPTPITRERIRALLDDAYRGKRPVT